MSSSRLKNRASIAHVQIGDVNMRSSPRHAKSIGASHTYTASM
ncbi:hypothetical protein W91_0589 [Bifidobacterium animalis subsp. lactis Bi-07]|nr:hypothetical protein W91_0589 [Bifidobacterium animalis subsp. lactis Bi-07]